ncbi:MAG: class I SAM-dependent methyltransferase [Verrucomicrobiia bacterium]
MRADYYETYHAVETQHWWFCGRREIVLSLLEHHSLTGVGRMVADIGCGTGANLQALRGAAWAVGVDPSDEALRFARTHGDSPLVAGTLPALPFLSSCFDVVLALDVVEHVEDDAQAVAELARVCKPGGTVFITVPAYAWLWSGHDVVNHHKRRYTRTRLANLVRAARLDVIQLSHFSTLLAPPIIACRLIAKLLTKFKSPVRAEPDTAIPSPILNGPLRQVFLLERAWLRNWSFPFGTSLLAIARRPS